MNIEVRIGRLVLEGIDVPHAQRPLLQAAVEGELARLLAAGGLGPGLQAGGALPSLPAGDIQLSRENNPTRLGQAVARAVHGAIGR
jgi:hypothetical protein